MTRDFDLLWDFGKPEETEAKFRALLPKQPDDFARWELLTQIARCQGLQKQFGEALATLDEVEQHQDGAPGRLRVRYLLERGRVLNSSGDKERARPLFEQAYRLAREIEEDFFAVDAAHMVAITETPEEAMEWNLKAVELAESSEDERAKGWLGSLYNNIGWTRHDEGKYQEALAIFQKALEYRVRQQKREPILVARWCVARCLRSLGRVEEALQIQRDLLSSREMDQEQDGYVSEELGECLLLLGKDEEAASHFQRAYEILSKDLWLPSSDPGRLERIRRLGAGCIEKSTEG